MSSHKKLGVNLWSRACGLMEGFEHIPENTPDILASWKIALVKQSTYCDLYTLPGSDPKELLASSIHRTGPIGLFLKFDARFIIVHPEPDPECRVWEEKLAYETPGSERAERFPKLRAQQAEVAVSVRDVDWSQFDIVIAIENAVPASITEKYPSVFWCTQLEHHKLKPYRHYLRHKPHGYDAFLHHRYGPNPGSIFKKPHVVEFPYGLNFVGGLREIYLDVRQMPRRVMLEDHQDFSILAPLLQQQKINFYQGGEPSGSLQAYHRRLAASRILLAPNSSRPLGGLAAIDAAAMDCLIIGNRAQMWNPFIVLPELDCREPRQAVRLAAELLDDSDRYDALIAKQSSRINWFGWVRPLRQIAEIKGVA